MVGEIIWGDSEGSSLELILYFSLIQFALYVIALHIPHPPAVPLDRALAV
jgi:hypothetical protein